MGGINQAYFVKEFLPQFHSRILEVGSKDYGSTIPFRKWFSWDEYVGLDVSEGDGVDLVADIENPVPVDPVDLVICCSVLEHVKRPWLAAENLTKILKPGGVLYLASPWVMRYHGYPDDYWRFSFSGIPLLFPDLEFGEMYFSTYKPAEFHLCQPEAENLLGLSSKNKQGEVIEKYLPYCEIHAVGTKPRGVALEL